MSFKKTDKVQAIDQFDAAFERLKKGQPINVPIDTQVSLTNVAKEAGKSPSALRVERYPELLQRIKEYMLKEGGNVKDEQKTVLKSRNRTLQQRLDDFKKQRDRLLSICHAQQELIEELREEVNRLSEGKVVNIINSRIDQNKTT